MFWDKFLWLEIQYKVNSLDVWSLFVENEALLTQFRTVFNKDLS